MKFDYRLWLYSDSKDQKLFGKGPYDLLKGVITYGSLKQSATNLGISYTKAFNTIKRIEKSIGFNLLDKQAGGLHGGKSEVTPEALILMEYYDRFVSVANDELGKIYDNVFSDFWNKINESKVNRTSH